jgi:hypothetical protein
MDAIMEIESAEKAYEKAYEKAEAALDKACEAKVSAMIARNKAELGLRRLRDLKAKADKARTGQPHQPRAGLVIWRSYLVSDGICLTSCPVEPTKTIGSLGCSMCKHLILKKVKEKIVLCKALDTRE